MIEEMAILKIEVIRREEIRTDVYTSNPEEEVI
jgi:hypothetical protein